ncbi:N-dimethyltransferase [Micromonospora pisi]|uniref:N-dimethyltransferase n=1 Tax=Micromonospora pisi TaxID=589240 RepID=A0A495JES1_9ACTN|nr:class I SAM-dependent methyltransferase [Micromonospora pisi]RKR86884.1 N-dimethyltransferase [Micromonospora pisi]
MFGTELADVYDLVYGARGQDFAAEAKLVAGLVRARRPHADSLLDVGCGTGEHLRWLRGLIGHVEGVDLSAAMVSVARAKLPGVGVHVADMCRFDLGRRFDAVISLSTAVAYLPSAEAMGAAVARMVGHLRPGGVLIVEPWYFPENFLDGHIAADIIRGQSRTISRVSRTERLECAARIESHYVVAQRDGIQHFSEVQDFGLWSRDQYLDAFRRAGCAADYLPDVQSGRGLFVAQAG